MKQVHQEAIIIARIIWPILVILAALTWVVALGAGLSVTYSLALVIPMFPGAVVGIYVGLWLLRKAHR